MTVDHPEVTAGTAAVDAALRTFLAERRAGAAAIGEGYATAVADLEEYVLRGGKRVRPTFAWTGWLGAGGDPDGPTAPAVLRTCAALELLHASALIHDDIVDASRTRRGFPSAHVAFADRHRERGWSGDPDAYGTGAALLVGDLALVWADDLVRTSGLPADAMTRVGPVWSAMRTEVLCGQLLDLAAEARGDESADAALLKDRYKTASYTVERPLHVGAAAAGADQGLVAAYRAFGADIGLAFQLRDDVLGVFGDPEVTGKPSGDDIREGKRTVLLATALRRADDRDPAAARFLRSRIGTDVSEDDLDSVRAILVGLGAVAYVEREITRRRDRAVAVLERSAATRPARERLAAMALSATQRSR
ncbi:MULTISPECIES: polyprenyl synthetase family protein [Streptomyces]|uniref:Geranylgeranyl pyrophosphate synthase n=2 Tax=Streptomyces TaxID=1883 RepID=A0A100Y7Y5_9ACTN|nr:MULTISPECIES: polyprenyl synthetase family protein [Streptomyces]KUH39312.1 geranylgeranyl pyrophosphate synthase [Streptomyces kanasensis]UUS33474.1 polyprenyl synthetase family protein [Streptomyces changanensis]